MDSALSGRRKVCLCLQSNKPWSWRFVPIIIFFLQVVVSIWYSSRLIENCNGKVHSVSPHYDGRLVRNPSTSNASPLCTTPQRRKIAQQLMLIEDDDIKNTTASDFESMDAWPRLVSWFKCPKATWIEQFYAEETNIGTSDFLGISVGCNKGHDAIRTARMGFSDAAIDPLKWKDEFHSEMRAVCDQDYDGVFQVNSKSTKRKGEMHCIEPMSSTFSELKRVGDKLDLESKGMVFTHAAIGSSSGVVNFPNDSIGTEWLGIATCNSINDKSYCVEVPMFSLEDYVARYVKGGGPINILQIDVEGNDFDVLFGAGSVLDSTHYLEFEYNWNKKLHLQDAVRLLDGKGFTCYWAGESRLWRISGCYFEHYNYFHLGWSNVACVHRSQKALYGRMEKMFTDILDEMLVNDLD